MRRKSISTGDGTTAPPDPSSLPVPLELPVVKRQPSHLADSRGRSRKKTLNSGGIGCLDPVDTLSIELDRNCLSCRLDKTYKVRDVTRDKVILKGVQDFELFDFNGLKNVILRDAENVPVARVCFKQKSLFYASMAVAVYTPCDVLAGTGEETSGFFMLSSKFLLRNSDGDELFYIDYHNKLLNSSFLIKSAADKEQQIVVAKVTEKSRFRIRLQITSQMSITSKVVLVGLCIALLHKRTPPSTETAEAT